MTPSCYPMTRSTQETILTNKHDPYQQTWSLPTNMILTNKHAPYLTTITNWADYYDKTPITETPTHK